MLNSRYRHLQEIRTFPKKKLKHVSFYCFNRQCVDYFQLYRNVYAWLSDASDSYGTIAYFEALHKALELDLPVYGFNLQK